MPVDACHDGRGPMHHPLWAPSVCLPARTPRDVSPAIVPPA